MTRDIFPYLPDIGAKKSDIIMFNFGIWHNDMKTFVGNLSEVYQYLTEFKERMPYLIWRDVGPQHFDTPLGEFACEGCPAPEYPFECKVRPTALLIARVDTFMAMPHQRCWLKSLCNGVPVCRKCNSS